MSVSRLEPSDYKPLTVTASSVICARPCVVQAVCITPAAAASAISLYDPAPFVEGTTPTTTNATLVVTIAAVANGSTIVLPVSASGINFKNGCVAVVTGAAATALVTVGSF